MPHVLGNRQYGLFAREWSKLLRAYALDAYAVAPGAWDETSLLRLHAGNVLVLYSIDKEGKLVVDHVVDSGLYPIRGTG